MKKRKPRSDAWHAGLTVEQQQAAWELCNQVGVLNAGQQIAQEFGLHRAPSKTALSNWWRDWPLRKAFLDFGSIAEKAKTMLQDTPELGLKTEQIEAMGQAMFTAGAVQAQDPKLFAMLRKLGQKDKIIELDRERFEREMCANYLDRYDDERARRIAESDAPRAEKIEALRKAFFADVDEFERKHPLKFPTA